MLIRYRFAAFLTVLPLILWLAHEEFNFSDSEQTGTSLMGPEHRLLHGQTEQFDSQGKLAEHWDFGELQVFSETEMQALNLVYRRQDETGNTWQFNADAAIRREQLWHLQHKVSLSKTSATQQPLLKLQAQELFYRTDNQDFWSDQAVQLSGPGYRVEAHGVRGNVERGLLQLTQQVKTQYEMDN